MTAANTDRPTYATLDLDDVEVRRLDDSAQPWRLVHAPTGEQIWFERETIWHGLEPVTISVYGYRSKRDAVAARDRLAKLCAAARFVGQ